MKILIAPDPALSTKAKPVKKIDKRIQKIAQKMIETLESQDDPMGVGLSGNQVGILERIFIIRPDEDAEIEVFINPKIVKTGKKEKKLLEGCLSIPLIWGHVSRPQSVTLKYQNLSGETLQKTFKDFAAVVIQHELDHLNGILFTQHVLEQGEQMYKDVDGKLEPVDIG